MAMRLHNYLGTKKHMQKQRMNTVEIKCSPLGEEYYDNNKPNECSSLLLLFASSPPLKLLRRCSYQ